MKSPESSQAPKATVEELIGADAAAQRPYLGVGGYGVARRKNKAPAVGVRVTLFVPLLVLTV